MNNELFVPPAVEGDIIAESGPDSKKVTFEELLQVSEESIHQLDRSLASMFDLPTEDLDKETGTSIDAIDRAAKNLVNETKFEIDVITGQQNAIIQVEQSALEDTRVVEAEWDALIAEAKFKIAASENADQDSETVIDAEWDMLIAKAKYRDASTELVAAGPDIVPRPSFTELPDNGFSRGTLLKRLFNEGGKECKALKLADEGQFTEAIVFKKTSIPDQKTIRLYRGINHVGLSILEQIPYAQRANTAIKDSLASVKGIAPFVDKLAHDLSYESLREYIEAVKDTRPKPDVLKMLEESLIDVENRILDGWSMQQVLMLKHIGHVGGNADMDISPYLSATFDPQEAMGYGQGGIMVIDVPIDEVDSAGASPDGEIFVRGALKQEWISAFLPREQTTMPEQGSTSGLEGVLQGIDSIIEVNSLSQEELVNTWKLKHENQRSKDDEQRAADVERVGLHRSKRLQNEFAEVFSVDQAVPHEGLNGSDAYKATLESIADFYLVRYAAIGKKIQYLRYDDPKTGKRVTFDRNTLNDNSVRVLRDRVLRHESSE